MINAKECVIIHSWHTFKRAWLLEEHIISGFIFLKKPKQFCSPLDVEMPIKYPYFLHLHNISNVYSDKEGHWYG